MRLTTIISFFLAASSAVAISNSTPIGNGSSTYNKLNVRLYQNFSMADGNVVQTGSISEISFQNIVFGGQSLRMKINGDIYSFKLRQPVFIENGYASAAGSTGAGSTGQGLAVAISETPMGSWNTYEKLESVSCTGDRIEECIYVPEIGRVCDSEYLTGTQTNLVEYGDRNLRANITLSSNNGVRLVDVGYGTKEFRRSVLVYEYDRCDANSFYNERRVREQIRRRLREKYFGTSGHSEKGKIKGH